MKKLSVTNTVPSEPLAFFLDENNSVPEIAEVLRQAGALVHLHRDHFTQGVSDEEWLSIVGQKGWIIITRDARIRYNNIERVALQNVNARVFVLVSKNMTASQMAAVIEKAYSAIEKYVARGSAPFIAKIFRDGSVADWI